MTEVSSCPRNWLERLSPEMRANILRWLPRDALTAFSETSSFMADETRSIRLRRFVVSNRAMAALQHWLAVGAAQCGCKCEGRRVCRIDNKSCRAVVIVCPKQKVYFATYVQTLVFPSAWSPECVELVRLVGELGPLQLRSVHVGSDARESWWDNAIEALDPHAAGHLFTASPTLTIVNPSNAGLLAIVNKRIPFSCETVASSCKSLEIRGRLTTSQPTGGWGGGDWADADESDEEFEAVRRVVVQAQHLLVDLGTGLDRALKGVFFFRLSTLTIITQSTSMNWDFANRVLSDNRNALQHICIRRGTSGPWTEPLTVEALPALHTVDVDWSVVGCLRNVAASTPSGQVTLIVHGYDADGTDEGAYALARDVLPSSHWRSVVFEEDEFWKLPEAAEGRSLRRQRLLQEMGAGFNPDFI